MRWGPILCPLQIELREGELTSRHAFLPLAGSGHGIRLLVGFHLFGTSDHIDLPEPLVNRLLCHALIQHLPDAALPDAIESLTSDYEMHMARLALPKASTAPEKPLRGRYMGKVVATMYPISELD